MDDAVLERTEALRSFQNAVRGRVAIVAAPEGFGKSVLLRSDGNKALAILDVRVDCTFERFVGELVRHVAPRAHGIKRSIAKVYARSLESEDGPLELATWFCRYLAGIDQAIAVDGIDAVADGRIIEFLRAVIRGSQPGLSWVLAGRDLARLRSFVPEGEAALVVGEDELRLTFPELKRLALRLAPGHAGGELFAVARKAAGSISRAVFLLRCMHFGVADVVDAGTAFETLLERSFAGLSDSERLETMAGILLEDGGGVEEGSLAREVSSVASRLRTTAPHLFEAGDARLQASFRSRLRKEIRTLMATNRTALFVRAADALDANGDTASAIALYCAVDAVERLVALVERHGAVGLEGEQIHVLREAISLIPEDLREGHALVVGLRGVDAAQRGHHAEAVELFERAITLSSPGDHEQTIRYWYACHGVSLGDIALVRRMLRSSVDFFRTRPQLRAAMMSLLGVACAMGGDAARAKNWASRARKVADAWGDDALSARVYQSAAYVSIRAGDLNDAHELGTRAIGFAEACGWPHVAAITYSLLYHVALEREDQDLILTYARCLADNADRSGNLGLHYLAIAASYEHEVERCNLPAIAELRAELGQFDVGSSPAFHDGHPALLARAMECAWEGRFNHAFGLLEPVMLAFETAPDATYINEPHAFSITAVYAAAAGMAPETYRALHLYRSASARAARPSSLLRARIEEALALRLLSREREAKLLLHNVLRSLPATRSRARIYAELVATLVDPDAGVERTRAELEDEMYASGWGGLARLVRSIVAGSRVSTESQTRRNRAIG